jgi:HCOMODA/2-hydroxy-3-carboxy-muconic semialdehyde decarboxylase
MAVVVLKLLEKMGEGGFIPLGRVPDLHGGSSITAGRPQQSRSKSARRLKMRNFLLVIAFVFAAAPALAQPKSAGAPDPKLVEDLVAANRVLADLGVVDGFGHVSVRHDKDPGHYLMARSMAPALVSSGDIVEYDLDSVAVDAKGRALYLERFIHGEIYKSRPDVKAIVHSHSPSVIPFGASTAKLRPIYHMSSFLGIQGDVPIFEIRDTQGLASDLLVRNPQIGSALARSLGGNTVVLMRGHGSVTVGNSIPEVVFRAYYTEMNARLQAEAMRLGTVTYLTPEEAAAATKTNSGVLSRAWDLWKRKAMKDGAN